MLLLILNTWEFCFVYKNQKKKISHIKRVEVSQTRTKTRNTIRLVFFFFSNNENEPQRTLDTIKCMCAMKWYFYCGTSVWSASTSYKCKFTTELMNATSLIQFEYNFDCIVTIHTAEYVCRSNRFAHVYDCRLCAQLRLLQLNKFRFQREPPLHNIVWS